MSLSSDVGGRGFLLVVGVLAIFSGTAGAQSTADELISRALANNPAHRSVVAGVARSEADLQAAEAERLPTVILSGGASLLLNPADPVSLSSAQVAELTGLPVTGDQPIVLFAGQEDDQYQVGVSVDQVIYAGGKVRTGMELASLGFSAAGLAVQQSQVTISAEALGSLYALRHLDRINALVAEQQEIAARIVVLAEDGFRNGLLVEDELLAARVSAGAVRLGGAEVSAQINQNLTALSAAVAMQFSSTAQLVEAIAGLPQLELRELQDLEALVAEALDQSVELTLLAAQERAAILQQRLEEQSQTWVPDLVLRLEATYGGPRIPLIQRDWFGQDSVGGSLTIGVQTTAFDGGRLSASLEGSAADRERAGFDLADARLEVERSLRNTYDALLLGQLSIEQARLEEQSARLTTARRRREWQAGSITELDYLETELEYQQARITTENTLLTYQIDYLTLISIAGRNPRSILGTDAGGQPE